MEFTAAPDEGGLGLTSAIHDAQNLCWKVATVLAGHADAALLDTYEDERRPRCAWLRQREIESDGAILVRPDRFIAWRAPNAAADPLGELAGALGHILARPVTGPVPAGSGVTS